MTFNENNGLKYFQFKSLSLPGISQAIFSRRGGLSPTPWNSLNLGGSVGDNPANVKGNLDLVLDEMGSEFNKLAQVTQIHSAEVITVKEPMDTGWQGDAMITDQAGVLLMMRFADCVPILFYDPVINAAGIAHAGWQGTLKEIPFHVARAMEKEFKSDPGNLLVGIGPSIGPDHYYVGEDVIRIAERVYRNDLSEVLKTDANGVKLDLWKANSISLKKAGVKEIELARICTACNLSDWFSHRGENGKTGRFVGLIGLR